jgi:hypothetical protein
MRLSGFLARIVIRLQNIKLQLAYVRIKINLN